MALQYEILDVFAGQAFAGNPLAVVHDSLGLPAAAMQAIAREFNLSETVFAGPPADPRHRAALRIFMPNGELPFAGHPTVGAAVALARRSPHPGPGVFVLEEAIGPVRCAVRGDFAEFDLPRLPRELPMPADADALFSALGLDPGEGGFENHRARAWSAGVPYIMMPVRGLSAAAHARINEALWRDLAGRIEGKVPAPYLYCREAHAADFHARMFAPWDGIAEDPATGSAAAAFAGQLALFEQLAEGNSTRTIEQGVEMGRPSSIRLETEIAGATLRRARIGGRAILVAEGTLHA